MHIKFFAVLFGAAYASLYARFASQWTYLAGLKNQIKASEVTANDERAREVVATWKTGFIEDAGELHPSSRAIFASTIAEWASDGKLKKWISDSYGERGQAKVAEVIERASKVYQRTYKDALLKASKQRRDEP